MRQVWKAANIKIGGMWDERLARSARSALQCIPGVDVVDVSIERGEAAVRYDPDKVVPKQFAIALFAMGFESHAP